MNGKMAVIRARLMGGSTPSELIKEGYSRSSVYAVRKPLKGQKAGGHNDSPRTQVPPIPQMVSNDPDIISAQKRVTLAKLENDLESAEGNTVSPTVRAIHAAVQQKGYQASFQEFVDSSFATLIVEHPEAWLGNRFTKWAHWVLDGGYSHDEQPNHGGQFGSALTSEDRSAFFEWLSQLNYGNDEDWPSVGRD